MIAVGDRFDHDDQPLQLTLFLNLKDEDGVLLGDCTNCEAKSVNMFNHVCDQASTELNVTALLENQNYWGSAEEPNNNKSVFVKVVINLLALLTLLAIIFLWS
jgi:hypothetical protein